MFTVFSVGAAASDHVNLAINDGRADARATADKPSAIICAYTNHMFGPKEEGSGLWSLRFRGGGFVSRTVLTASRCACRLCPGNRKCGASCGTSEPVPRLRR